MSKLELFAPLLVIPAVYLVVTGLVIIRRRREAAVVGGALFTISILAGAWAITRSRSSTAEIGFLFLPSFAAVGGMLGIASALSRTSRSRVVRLASWFCLAGATALVGSELWSGVVSIRTNHQRDEAYQKSH